MRAFILVVLLSVPFAAHAAVPASAPSETRIDFGAEGIDGVPLTPTLDGITSRKIERLGSLIKLRAHFRAEILQSIMHH
jgi:hypothetical protein